MQISEALDQVSKMYVPGVVEFYEDSKTNPWQAAHDRYEAMLLLWTGQPEYFDKMAEAAKNFVQDCKKLIETFKALHPEQPELITNHDAFHISDEQRVRELQSLAGDNCQGCGASHGVRIAFNQKENKHALYCKECVA